jgi:integrase/recombinase XerD
VETLALTQPIPLTNHPAEVYLRSLAAGSRPTMSQSLDAIARLLTDNECDRLSLDWAALRYRHTSSIQAALGDLYSPTTVQKMICALRRVLLEARRLGLMSAEDYQQAVELPTIRAVRSLRGRALSRLEIHALMQVGVIEGLLS